MLTEQQKKEVTENALRLAELEEMGTSIMIPFMKYADKALFGNTHFIKKADKAEQKQTDKTVLNLPLFLRLGNKALKELKLPYTIEATWNGQIGFVNYDPNRKDI